MKLFCKEDHTIIPEIVVINGRKTRNPLLYTIKGKRRRKRIIVKHSLWLRIKKRYWLWQWERDNKKKEDVTSTTI